MMGSCNGDASCNVSTMGPIPTPGLIVQPILVHKGQEEGNATWDYLSTMIFISLPLQKILRQLDNFRDSSKAPMFLRQRGWQAACVRPPFKCKILHLSSENECDPLGKVMLLSWWFLFKSSIKDKIIKFSRILFQGQNAPILQSHEHLWTERLTQINRLVQNLSACNSIF